MARGAQGSMTSTSSTSASLTSTSYAVLGLLAVQPWTTYELAQQMKRAVGQFWPRAESRIYEEPKKLVAHGLATASSDRVGRRQRTRYAITDSGRRSLAAWIQNGHTKLQPRLEVEDLLKVFFAEHGSRDDLLASIGRLRSWAEDRLRLSEQIARGYLRGEGAYVERLPWLLLTGRFLDEYVLAVKRWADWADAEVASWPHALTDARPDQMALHDMVRNIEAALSSGPTLDDSSNSGARHQDKEKRS